MLFEAFQDTPRINKKVTIFELTFMSSKYFPSQYLGNVSKIELSVTVEPFSESKKSDMESAHVVRSDSFDENSFKVYKKFGRRNIN